MVSVKVSTQDEHGKIGSYVTSINGTLSDARDYFMNRVLTSEIFDYSADRFVEVKNLVVNVELAK